jgi:hypothetical protein
VGLQKENIQPNLNPYTGKTLEQVRGMVLEEKFEKKIVVGDADK